MIIIIVSETEGTDGTVGTKVRTCGLTGDGASRLACGEVRRMRGRGGGGGGGCVAMTDGLHAYIHDSIYYYSWGTYLIAWQ